MKRNTFTIEGLKFESLTAPIAECQANLCHTTGEAIVSLNYAGTDADALRKLGEFFTALADRLPCGRRGKRKR